MMKTTICNFEKELGREKERERKKEGKHTSRLLWKEKKEREGERWDQWTDILSLC